MRRVTRIVGAAAALGLLAACGGGTRALGPVGFASASGPIATACRASDRQAANRAICGCIQAAADYELSAAQQRRGAAWFDDPHRAQEVRQSDRSADRRMWEDWKVFVARAERMCRS